MSDSSSSSGARSSRGSGGFTVHLADELEVYFSEVKDGRPVGFVASPKWRPPTDVFETGDAIVIYMDVAGLQREDFQVSFADGVLTISGERKPRGDGKRHYHSMEVQVGPFERRLLLPVPVNPDTMHAAYDLGFLEVRLQKIPRPSGQHSVKVE